MLNVNIHNIYTYAIVISGNRKHQTKKPWRNCIQNVFIVFSRNTCVLIIRTGNIYHIEWNSGFYHARYEKPCEEQSK